MPNTVEQNLSKFEAEKILDALRVGTVPIQHLELLTAGREPWLEAIAEDLLFVSQGASKIRFIAAEYGGGKTHFLNLLKKKAFTQNFLVSYVELHSREAPMDKFEVIFPKVMRGIETSNSEYGLEALFDHWVRHFTVYERQAIDDRLKAISPSLDFRAALRTYLEYSDLDSPESKDYLLTVLGWLGGHKLRQYFAAKTGIRNSISI